MQVSRQGKSSRREFIRFEIVTAVEGKSPFLGKVHATVKTERLHNAAANARIRIAKIIIEPEIPRDVEVVIA